MEFAVGNLAVLRHHWKGVLDGDVESIHQARIATRRIRAALRIVAEPGSDAMKLSKALGRALGPVRELDVTYGLLADLDRRVPAAGSAIAALRLEIDQRQQRARRRLIKKLDRVELKPLARLNRAHPLQTLRFWKDWRDDLRAEIASRTGALQSAIDVAPAVYMPKRLHQVRIALKKLRYALEVGVAAGLPIAPGSMRQAGKLQDLLGRLHDSQVVGEIIDRLKPSAEDLGREVRVLDAVVAAECAAVYTKYLGRRDRLRAICDHAAALGSPRPVAQAVRLALQSVPAVGAAALPLAMWRLNIGNAAAGGE
jgi:CHAD domain-containing protein